MKSKVLKQIFKICVAGVTSLAILCVFCLFYYNLSVHYTSESGSTDYKWATDRFYAKATEGFAWGRTDKNGFNNSYKEDFEKIDVLFMGSSHLEAFNGQQKYNTVYQYNTFYERDGKDKFAYNIGVSGHSLLICLDNLEDAIKEFKPTETIVIETPTIHMRESSLELLVNNKMYDLESEDNKFAVALANVPYLRLMYNQLVFLRQADAPVQPEEFGDVNKYTQNLNFVLKRASQLAEKHGIKLMVVYNSPMEIDSKGNLLPQTYEEYVDIMDAACKNADITFVNMYQPYAAYYKETYRLPHGFSNTRVGTGHINRYGHQVIAETVYDILENGEGR